MRSKGLTVWTKTDVLSQMKCLVWTYRPATYRTDKRSAQPPDRREEPMNEQVIVGEAVAGRSATVRKQLLRMVSNMAVSTFDFIELIAEAQENNYASSWGFSSTVDYGTKS